MNADPFRAAVNHQIDFDFGAGARLSWQGPGFGGIAERRGYNAAMDFVTTDETNMLGSVNNRWLQSFERMTYLQLATRGLPFPRLVAAARTTTTGNLDVQVAGCPPGSTVVLGLATSVAPQGAEFVLGASLILLDVSRPELVLLRATADQDGVAQWRFAAPQGPVGVTVYGQGVTVDAAGSVSGFTGLLTVAL